jgi:hypothetical protein
MRLKQAFFQMRRKRFIGQNGRHLLPNGSPQLIFSNVLLCFAWKGSSAQDPPNYTSTYQGQPYQTATQGSHQGLDGPSIA